MPGSGRLLSVAGWLLAVAPNGCLWSQTDLSAGTAVDISVQWSQCQVTPDSPLTICYAMFDPYRIAVPANTTRLEATLTILEANDGTLAVHGRFGSVPQASDDRKYILDDFTVTSTETTTLVRDVTDRSLKSGTYYFTPVLAFGASVEPKLHSAKGRFVVNLFIGPAISVYGFTNAARPMQDTPTAAWGQVAPGEIITIFGANIGPSVPTTTQLTTDGTSIVSSLGGTRVLFNGEPAPVLYASAGQVNAVAPYSLKPECQYPAGDPWCYTTCSTTTTVAVEYGGVLSNSIKLQVVPYNLGLFTMNGSGLGQAAALNEDSTLNSLSNPAKANSTVVLFATGTGALAPPKEDGKLCSADLANPTSVNIQTAVNGTPEVITYSGCAPGLVHGLIQLNVRVINGVWGDNIRVILAPPGSCYRTSQWGPVISVR